MSFNIPAIRGNDAQGKGYFGAPRGKRKHKGVDFVADPGDPVRAFMPGRVTKLGYPYAHDLSFRYVEVTASSGARLRYFYVRPTVNDGQKVAAGMGIGECQELPYEGITQHYHFEVIVNGTHVDPLKFLSDNA